MSDLKESDPQDSSDNAETVVLLSGDLIFASRVRAAAQNAGYAFKLSGALPEIESIKFVIVDLSTRSGLLEQLMDYRDRVCPNAITVAYGPHVQEKPLELAKQIGVQKVMTRGQFDRSLATLFTAST
ncbi:histidine kinase [Stieleria sp. JC731]|uniref:histidine kinase n=1 Tax=Pirellulaceae TaxID=2691357 RepID=UPI001E4D6EF4|nr:histidine kinase [Stieleria sp. JC731]MCC9599853.1 histidine kinase [Stieleria sp. JC731]